MVDLDKIEQNIQCVKGTMNLEGLDLTEECHNNLSRYALGEATFDEIMHDIYNKFNKAVYDEINNEIQSAIAERITEHPEELKVIMESTDPKYKQYYPYIQKALYSIWLSGTRELTEYEEQVLDELLDVDKCLKLLNRKWCGRGVVRDIIEKCEHIKSKRELTNNEYYVYQLALRKESAYKELEGRSLTEEESDIYDDWLNAEADDTGERLF